MEAVMPELTKEQFKRFRNYIDENSGIFLDDYRADTLHTSLSIRMKALRLNDYNRYYALLLNKDEGEKEFKQLLNLVTINETSFFRYAAQFDVLRNRILPEIIERKKETSRMIKIWSAGCSTGEEPYSIAMVLLEMLNDPASWKIDILGTDISQKALVDAQKGVYVKHSLRNTEQYYLKKYFKKDSDGHMHIDRKVMDMVRFNFHNLKKDPYPYLTMGGWDIIFCRNVTIYFQLDSVRQVIDNFYKGLNESGYLFIGHAETLYQVTDKLKPIELEDVFVYRRTRKHDLEREVSAAKASIIPLRNNTKNIREVLEKDSLKAEKMRIKDKKGISRSEEETICATAYKCFQEERFDECKALLQSVIENNDENMQAHLLRSQLYANEGRINEALGGVNKVLALEPMSPKAHFLLALLYEKQGKMDEAIRELKRVIFLDRRFALAYMNLADIYTAKKMHAEALREYNNAIESLCSSLPGEWEDFAGGFTSDVLVETCQRNIKRIRGPKA